MKLHGYWRSSTSYRLRIALALKGIDYENQPVDLATGAHRADPYLKRNPFGGVPLLEAAGHDRTQSLAILEWLDEAYPDTRPLLPPDIERRFTARELSHAIASEVHAPLNLRVLQYLKREMGQTQDAVDTWYHHWLAVTLVPLEARLKALGTGDFLFDKPGLFEIVLIPQLYNARRFAFDLDAMPRMVRIETACNALVSFERAHPDNQPDAPRGEHST